MGHKIYVSPKLLIAESNPCSITYPSTWDTKINSSSTKPVILRVFIQYSGEGISGRTAWVQLSKNWGRKGIFRCDGGVSFLFWKYI